MQLPFPPFNKARLRTDPDRSGQHIVITGTGRAGTTFLVQLLTELDFDTGFSRKQSRQKVDGISSAGLELPLVSAASPYVLKSPWYCQQLDEALASGAIKIRMAILPMRNLHDAAESRRRVYHEALARGLQPLQQAGSLVLTEDPAQQEQMLLHQFYEGLMALVSHQVPLILLEFPRTVRDGNYLYGQLAAVMDEHGVSKKEFMAAFAKIVRPELVHEFGQGES